MNISKKYSQLTINTKTVSNKKLLDILPNPVLQAIVNFDKIQMN